MADDTPVALCASSHTHTHTYTHTHKHTQNHQPILAPFIVFLLQQASTAYLPPPLNHNPPQPHIDSDSPAFSQAVAAKEAAVNAVALGVYELHECIPFSTWLRTTLLPVGVADKYRK